jgi:hypothetical protein
MPGSLLECVLVFFALIFVTVVAGVLLGIRDFHAKRAHEELRPLEDRIRDIQEGAAFMIVQLNRVAERPPSARHNTDWIPPVLEYLRRLERIASVPTSAPEEALALANEAGQFEREQRLKGLSIGDQAGKLAALLERRKSALGPGTDRPPN